MKAIFLSLLLLIGIVCEANMASPRAEGTMASTVFSSRDVDVLREGIVIRIAKEFNSAKIID